MGKDRKTRHGHVLSAPFPVRAARWSAPTDGRARSPSAPPPLLIFSPPNKIHTESNPISTPFSNHERERHSHAATLRAERYSHAPTTPAASAASVVVVRLERHGLVAPSFVSIQPVRKSTSVRAAHVLATKCCSNSQMFFSWCLVCQRCQIRVPNAR